MAAFYDWAEGEALGDQHRTVHNELGYIKRGTGTPEGVLTADVGSLFIRSDGGASSTLYVKETGTGNTGWVALGSISGIDHGTLTGLADDDHPQYMTSAETDTSIATHAGLADPHTGYRLESADHTHASTGLQAGTLDHGTALTGLTDDDHTQYRLESVDHTHQSTGAEAGKLDHGLALNGLTDDDHTQYALETQQQIVADFSKTGTLATGTGAFRWYNDSGVALVVRAVRASVGTAPTGASIIIDVNENGTTLYTTQGNRPTIAISGNTTDATLPDDTSIANNNYLTIDIDQVGSTVAGADLVVQVWLSLA